MAARQRTYYFTYVIILEIMCCDLCVVYKRSKDLNTPINPLTSIGDKESISPYINQYNIQLTSHENKEQYHLGGYWLIQHQILQTDNIRISW